MAKLKAVRPAVIALLECDDGAYCPNCRSHLTAAGVRDGVFCEMADCGRRVNRFGECWVYVRGRRPAPAPEGQS